MATEILFKKVAHNHPDFHLLIEELNKEFWVRYPDTQQNFEPFNKVDNTCRVIIAYADKLPVGSGCYRPKNTGTIEIKRMYVKPSFRNAGIAGKILQKLESLAASEGYERSILETGIKQPEAIRAYQKNGYHIIPNFPPYENVSESICMEKLLPKV